LVLSYNSRKHLQANLDSLLALDYPSGRLEIILVDNASSDGSADWVRQTYPAVRVVETGANLGFAGGNNAGAQAASHPWLAILNPDTRVTPGWLRALTAPLAAHPEAVCIASKMLAWDGESIDFADAAINFMGWGCQPGLGSRQLAAFDEGKDLLFACGGAMLIRREVFLEMGGFDEAYMAFFEDVDLGWRLWLRGYQVRFAPEAVVYHRHHGSWDGVASPRIWLLAERNTLFTLIKNYDDDHLARVLPAALLLLLQRSWLDVNADPAVFQTPAAPDGTLFGWRYYVGQAIELVRGGEWRALWRRTREEVGRRRSLSLPQADMASTGSAFVGGEDGRYPVPAICLSRLLAGREVLGQWAALAEKRRQVQASRRRTDTEVFPLFRWELVSNFGDERFIRAMNHAAQRFRLDEMFAGETPPVPEEVRALSDRVAMLLFRVMDTAVQQSKIPTTPFSVGAETPPEETYLLPEPAVALLAEVNTLLWTLPERPLAEMLGWLEMKLTAVLQQEISPNNRL
jgi:GT2 family glycosyltransferase